MKIETAQSENHPTPFPYDPAGNPALATPTVIVPGQLAGPTIDARDTTGEWQAQREAGEADVAAAQAAGMDARNGMVAHYQAQAMPLGGQIGDGVDLPPVPANAVPPAQSDLYPYAGMEPTPAAAGFPGEYGGA